MPNSVSASYFDPQVLARIQNLQLRARYVVEGFTAGLHASPYRGHSLEFAEHREYSPGDEIKHIDWKVYGRSDRIFIKQFEEETNLRLYLLLDCSGSMGFQGKKSALSKYAYGATLCASLAHLALKQGDSAGLGCFSDRLVNLIPPRNSFSHLKVLLEELQSQTVGGETSLSQCLETVAHSLKKRSLIVLVSDFLDEEAAILRALQFLRFKKHELVVIHLLDREEKDFSYTGAVRFQSLENREILEMDAEAFRRDYQRSLDRFLANYKMSLAKSDIQYNFHCTDEPIDQVMQKILE